MKKEVIFVILSLFFTSFIISNVGAVFIHNITSNNVEYSIELISALDGQATFRVKDSLGNTKQKQVYPEQWQLPYATDSIGDLYFILLSADESSAYQTLNATVLIGIEQNFSSNGPTQQNLTINGNNYTIQFILASDSEVRITILNYSGEPITKTISDQGPLPINEIKGSTKFGDIEFIISTYSDENSGLFSLNSTIISFTKLNFFYGPESECEIINQSVCVNETAYKVCGNYYNNPYELKWSVNKSCSEFERCSNGQCIIIPGLGCVNDDECAGSDPGPSYCSGKELCTNIDDSKCIIPSGKIVGSCKTIFSPSCIPCEVGCQDGECVGVDPIIPIVSNSSNNCNEIGLRQNNKFCSSSKIWTNQKINKASCENNFECRSNICANGVCQNSIVKEPNYLLYLFLFLLFVFIIVVVIILFLKFNK